MSFFQKGTLRKAFAAALLVTAFSAAPGFVQPAEASVSTAGAVAAASAASAAAAAAAAANARYNREAQNDVIVNPTDQNIERLAGRGLVDNSTIPYIRATVAEMKIAPGTNPDDISYEQRDTFMNGLQNKRLVVEMSQQTGADAVAKGMDGGLSPYFASVKSELGYTGAVTLPQAHAMEDAMGKLHWDNDTKPALEKAGLIIGGIAAVGGAAVVLGRRRSSYYD